MDVVPETGTRAAGFDRTVRARPPARLATLRRAVRDRRLTPAQFKAVTLVAAWALAVTIVSGGAVRLTGSGLGCPDWPTCASHRVVAPWQYHAWVEFGNRLVTTVVSVVAVVAVAAALCRRPRRRDLTWLSLGLVAGVLAEIVLGGLTVLYHLAPGFVMAHFLLAAVFLADAVVLHHRAGLAEEAAPARTPGGSRRVARATPSLPLVGGAHLWLGRLLLAAAAVVVVLGTVVTSTGPHGGDPAARRFALSLHTVAQWHGGSVELFLGLTLITLWSLNRSGAPASVMRRGEVLLVVLVAQGGIGYLQYFTGEPVALVGLHLAGATALIVAVLHFNMGLHTHPVAAIQADASLSAAQR